MATMINRDAPKSGIAGLMAMKGRFGDTELVHMNPEEVKGLQALGKLTVNPQTGLPEAFNLASMLPAAAGLAASFAFPGAPFLAPMMASGITSAGVNKGDVGAIAFDSLLAGAGAYLGGAEVGADTLRGIGASDAALGTALPEVVEQGGAAAMAGEAGALGAGAASANTPIPLKNAIPAMMGFDPGTQVLGDITAAQLAKGALSASPTAALGALGQPMSGGDMLEANKPPELAAMEREAAQSSYGTRAGEEISQTPAVRDGLTEDDILNSALGKTDPLKYFNVPKTTVTPAGLYGDSSGVTGDPTNNMSSSKLPGTQFAAHGGGIGEAFERMGGDYDTVARAVAGRVTSGRIPYEGEGDAMSDHVMYPVAKQRPSDPDAAALSPDEYIIDGHTVAALGNGSSDAGSRRLDKFVAGVRQKAYGKNAQPRKINGIAELARLS